MAFEGLASAALAYISFKGTWREYGSLGSFKGNIGGYFKALLKAILGNFDLFWPISWLPLLSGPVKQRPLWAL